MAGAPSKSFRRPLGAYESGAGAAVDPRPARLSHRVRPRYPAGTVSWNVVPALRYAPTIAFTCDGVSTWSFTCRT
ncbi:hypothetical protein GCM10010298_40070 [Streptomyces microflavus]|nr:hypothetical protein GCM10010298_40070 [Streptomyces microflavus]